MKELMSGAMAVALFAMLTWVSSATASEEVTIEILEDEPSQQLIDRVRTAFDEANVIRVSYIPRHHMGTPFLPKEQIPEGWTYQFSYRCIIGSCLQTGEQVREYFSSGLKQALECPGPYYSAVELIKGTGSVMTAYVDHSGRCFTIDGDSYFSVANFDKFVASKALYPGIVSMKQYRHGHEID